MPPPGRVAVSCVTSLLAAAVLLGTMRPAPPFSAPFSPASSPRTHPAAGRPAAGPLRRATETAGTTRVEMRRVDFVVDPGIVLHIHRLRGTMRSRAGGPIVFDDKRSFVIHLASAEVGLTGPDLTTLLNRYVFAYRGAPLTDLHVTVAGSHIVQTGRLHKVVSLPFRIEAVLGVTPDGHIRIHPTRTVIVGLPVDRLMHGLGLSLQRLIDLRGARGASVRGNDIYLAPDSILPPPAIDGRVTAVRIAGGEVIQTFGGAEPPPPLPIPDPTARNFMLYEGGTLRFGRLMMLQAEMQIVDLDPTDPFRFNLDRYNAQLVAGYSRTLPDLGLEVYMPDIDDVH